ncbi:MAG: energy transducer TonB [Nitrospinota bacterium]
MRGHRGGSLRYCGLLSLAVHAGLLAALALLPWGGGPAPGLPVRLVQLPPPAGQAQATEAAPPAPARELAPVPLEEAAAPRPAPNPPPPVAAQPSEKKETAPPEAAAAAPLPQAAPSPPSEALLAPPAAAESPKTERIAGAAPPLPQAAPSPAPNPPRTASLPPPAEDGLSAERLRERLAQITARIEKAKRYPEDARLMGFEGTAVVAFRILPGGGVGDLAIRQSSGHSSLDAASLEAVRRAQPFPFVRHALVLPIRYTLQDAER